MNACIAFLKADAVARAEPLAIEVWAGTFWPNVGGVESHLAQLLPALAERGHRLRVITEGSHSETFCGIQVHRLPFQTALRQPTSQRLAEIRSGLERARSEWDAEVVHLSCPGPESFFLTRSPHLVTIHAMPAAHSLARDTLLGRTLRRSSWTNCVSHAVRDGLLRELPELAPACSVIHHGLEPAAVDATVKHGLACLGRLSLEKGFDLAIQALAGLDSGTRAGLKIAGDGPQRERLVGLTRELGLTSRVSWAGWVATEQVGRFIAEAELVLVPSREEAFGLTALEAAFAGRPVVASRVGGLPEVVLEGQTGLLVPPEDVRALIEAIQHLLSHPEMASAMGREAARLARRRFPLSRCVDGYEKLFRDLASRNTPQDRPGYGRKSRSC